MQVQLLCDTHSEISIYLLSCDIYTSGTVTSPSQFLVFELAIVIVLLQLLSYCGDTFTNLFTIGLVRFVLGPQVWIPAEEVAGECWRFTALFYLRK